MPPTERWQFEWRRAWSDVWSASFEQTWQAMFEAADSAHVYHQPALVRAWADTCGRTLNAEPMFGLARSTAGVQLLLPWVVVRYAGRLAVRRALEPVGGDIFGYHNPLLAGAAPDAVDWAGFWRAVRADVNSACDQALFRLLQPAYAPDIEGRLDSEDSPVLDLRGRPDLGSVLSACSSSHRIDVKRQLRRLGQRGDVSLWIAGGGEVADALAAVRLGLLPAYRALWSGRDRRNTLLGPGLDAFLEAIVSRGLPAGWTHVSVLRVGETPIAWHAGFADRGRLYWWLPTHDLTWSNHSPGKVLLALLIDAVCRAGWTEVHMLAGHHDYKTAWRPSPQPLAAIGWAAPTIRGRLMAWYDARGRAS